MQITKLHSFIFIILILFNQQLFSQKYADKPTDARTNYGIFANVGLNLHSASFKGLSGIPSCCPRYETGNGLGYNIGTFISFPLSQDFELSFRVFYNDLSGKLTKIEPTYVSDLNGNGTQGEFEHSLNATISSVGLSPLLSFRLTDEFAISAGIRAGYILQKAYSQKETIIKPSWGTFEGTNSRTRNERSGTIPDASALDISGVLGASYNLPISQNYEWYLVPEAYLSYSFLPVANDLSWNIITINGGIALKYSPRAIIPPKPLAPPPALPPLPSLPVPPQEPALAATIVAKAVDENGRESDVTILKVEEFLGMRMHPILNYIFFDENSSIIPDRYIKLNNEQKNQFSDKLLYNLPTLDIYYNVLNIVGKRMSQYPQAEITITGCNSDENKEKGNIQLSNQRANAVKNYLVNVWKIPESRIKIANRNLPSTPSTPTDPDGIVENRRAEITSNIPQIFEPLIIRDTIRESNPPIIRFKSNVKAEAGSEKWELTVSQSKGPIKIFKGIGQPPSVIEWDLAKEQENIPRFDEPLLYKLEVIDKDNKRWASNVQQLPVEQMTIEKKMNEMLADKEFDRFSLILFDFNKFDLNEANLRIAEFAKKRIKKNSTVSIKGYTDRMGDENHNLQLSLKRAQSTAKILGVDFKYVIGLGETLPLLYNNDVPEGRFYCRTVNIEIVTPIQ